MLVIENLSKSFSARYNAKNLVLSNISFSLPDNGLFFVLGKSGCGKSTLLNLIAGFEKPDEGTIKLDDKEITSFRNSEAEAYLRDNVGFIFQRYNLIEDLSLFENLEIALSIKNISDTSICDEYLKKYGLFDKKKQKVSTLSGGEKQRLSLIRAIINSPKLILADEPTGALDLENSIKLMEELKEISKSALVICVTHSETLANTFGDGIIHIKNGEIVEYPVLVVGDNKIEKKENYRKKKNEKYIRIMTRKNIRNNLKLDFINSISSTFSIIVLLMSLFFRQSVQNSHNDLIQTFTDADTFEISKESTESIDSSILTLVKAERPKNEELVSFLQTDDVVIFDNYDFFFGGEKNLTNRYGKFSDFIAKPFIEEDLDYSEVVVNNIFANKYKEKFGRDILNQDVVLNLTRPYTFYSSEFDENYNLLFKDSIEFKVVKIQDEFGFMNEAAFYYSPIYFNEKLKENFIKELCVAYGKDVTRNDILRSSSNDNIINSYKVNAFSKSIKSRQKMWDLMNKNTLKVSNSPHLIVNSFMDLSNSIFIGLSLFIGLNIVITIFIAAFLSYTMSVRNRKDSAILSALGAKKSDLKNIYISEEIFSSYIGIFIGIGIMFLLVYVVNIFLKAFFKLPNFITVDIADLILLSALLMAVILAVCYIPLVINKSKKLHEELKEE